jgi:hypothetical protein
MKLHDFADLLHLDVHGRVDVRTAANETHVLLTLDTNGDRQRLFFGLPYFTAPRPLLIGGLNTEKNTQLRAPLLFTWIEDNFIHEPRAEIFGLTTEGEQPVMYLRDFDMDRPREIWLRAGEPQRWRRLAGVVHDGHTLHGDDGTLDAFAATAADDDDRAFAATLRTELAAGRTLKAALRARRKFTDAARMARADAWRIVMTATGYHFPS